MARLIRFFSFPAVVLLGFLGFASGSALAQSQPDVQLVPPNPAVGQNVTAHIQVQFSCPLPSGNPQGKSYDFNQVGSEFIMDIPTGGVCITPPGPLPYEVGFSAPGPGVYPLRVYFVSEDTLFPAQPEDRIQLVAEGEIVLGVPQAMPIPTLGLTGLLGLALLTLLLAGWGFRKRLGN